MREGALSCKCAEIGMVVRASEAGRGLGTRVLAAMLRGGFSEWPWLRLSWRCDDRNLASMRVAEKGGALSRLTASFREALSPDARSASVGFRCAKSLR